MGRLFRERSGRRLAECVWVFLFVFGSNLASASEASEASETFDAEELQEALGEVERAEKVKMPSGIIQLDETVISGNQELPKVLYILPWRQPGGLRDIELKAEFTEVDLFRRLYPRAYRRELKYFETLDGNTRRSKQ